VRTFNSSVMFVEILSFSTYIFRYECCKLGCRIGETGAGPYRSSSIAVAERNLVPHQ